MRPPKGTPGRGRLPPPIRAGARAPWGLCYLYRASGVLNTGPAGARDAKMHQTLLGIVSHRHEQRLPGPPLDPLDGDHGGGRISPGPRPGRLLGLPVRSLLVG
jgi:hypothetical protein